MRHGGRGIGKREESGAGIAERGASRLQLLWLVVTRPTCVPTTSLVSPA